MLAAGSCLARGHTLLRDKDWSAQSGHLHGRSTLEAPRGQRGCITVQRLHSPSGSAGPRALPLHLCPRPRLRVCRSQGTKPKTTGEANAGQQRVSILSTLPSDPGELREGEPTGLQRFPSSFKKSQTEDRPRLPTQVSAHSGVCSLSGTRDLNAASGSQHRSQQPTFRALPALTAGQAPRGWRALLPSPPALAPSSQSHPPRRSGSFRRVGAFLPHVCRQHPSHAASLALPPALLLLAF